MVKKYEIDVDSLGSGDIPFTETKVKLTPKFCDRFLDELEEFEGERNKRDYWADHLASLMVRGLFRFEQVVLAMASLDGVNYRLNGQHTCWARREFADDPTYSREVRLLTYTVQNKEDIRNLYTTFDQHGKRTRGHVVTAQLVGFNGWSDVSNQMINLTSQGYPMWKWEQPMERKTHDTREIAYLLKTENIELGVKVGKFLTDTASGKDGKLVRRAPVVAAMFGTWSKSGGASVDFWSAIVTGAGLSKNDPRNRLRAELLSASVGSGDQTAGKKNRTQEQMLRLCINAWNAWRAGEERTGLKANVSGPRPKFH
jgi:hypothetical protein